jgi:glutaredoxin-related protein
MVGARKGLIGIVHERTIRTTDPSGKFNKFSLHYPPTKSVDKINYIHKCYVNFIKSRALNHRQFKEYLADLFLDYEDVSYYCEVRWLSKGQMLKRFYDLRQDIADFMDIKGNTIN